MTYKDIIPITQQVIADRQGVRRHYGVHPYFTRRPYNVVREYILKYSKVGDRILDPFGGSGVTAIEAFLENRIGIQNDINPLANFISSGIAGLAKGELSKYEEAIVILQEKCERAILDIYNVDETQLKPYIKKVPLPPNIRLPKNSDAENYFDLFTKRQLLSLATIKKAIDELPDEHAKKAMLLSWSATLSKINKTFLSASGRAESRGGSSVFSIYRYKVAKDPVELPPWATFKERAQNIIRAKAEIDRLIDTKKRTEGWKGSFEAYNIDVNQLSKEFKNSIDYIFTDPPYGGHISYLDLSTLWNNWLGFVPNEVVRNKELIVGGELNFDENHYVEGLDKSIKSCLEMLKPTRWLSVVFQHWNILYFKTILTSASESGAELRAAVSQVGDPIWSMHKKKNANVLAGEMILTFCKTGQKKKINQNGTFNVKEAVKAILSENKNGRIFGEFIFNKIIIEAWQKSAINALDISKDDFVEIISQCGWSYDQEHHSWVKGDPAANNEPLFATL